MCAGMDSQVTALTFFSTRVLLSIFKDTLLTERLTRNTDMNRYSQKFHRRSKKLADERSPSR